MRDWRGHVLPRSWDISKISLVLLPGNGACEIKKNSEVNKNCIFVILASSRLQKMSVMMHYRWTGMNFNRYFTAFQKRRRNLAWYENRAFESRWAARTSAWETRTGQETALAWRKHALVKRTTVTSKLNQTLQSSCTRQLSSPLSMCKSWMPDCDRSNIHQLTSQKQSPFAVFRPITMDLLSMGIYAPAPLAVTYRSQSLRGVWTSRKFCVGIYLEMKGQWLN